MTYHEQVLDFLYYKGYITAGDIQRITNTTSAHTVIQTLRRKGYLGKYEYRKENGKSFKVHFLKDKQLSLM